MLNKFKQKLKDRKPMEPKKKALIKGLVFGFLAGGLATITAVGIVGCSMTQGESKQPQARKLVLDDTPLGTWTINRDLGYDVVFPSCLDVRFSSNSIEYNSFFYSDVQESLYYGTEAVWDIYDGWVDTYYRYIDVYEYGSSGFYEWLTQYATLTSGSGPVTSSSEATTSSASTTSSAATTSEPVATSSEDATTSVASSVPSIGFTFGESNPFSSWAINPLSGDGAVNYDGGAPWLLYTGQPSSNGATTQISALSTDYVVGDFYVAGNPNYHYDTIRVVTLNLSTDNVFVLNGGTDAIQVSADQFNRGAFMVSEVQYRNSLTSSSVKVFNFGTTAAKLGSNDVTALTAGAWLNVGYRSIVWQGGDATLSVKGYQAPASWWLENNALSSQAAVSTMILGDSNTGVFGLLASAFGSFGAIFGIALIPGLTIGTLLFVPLVVMIIFAIIKLLQK